MVGGKDHDCAIVPLAHGINAAQERDIQLSADFD